MLENDYGYICEICSISAYIGGCLVTDYNATKAAVLNFSEGLRAELILAKKTGISVTCICPGAIDTTLVPANFLKQFNLNNSVMSPQNLAYKTIEAICRKDFIVTIPKRYFWLRAMNT